MSNRSRIINAIAVGIMFAAGAIAVVHAATVNQGGVFATKRLHVEKMPLEATDAYVAFLNDEQETPIGIAIVNVEAKNIAWAGVEPDYQRQDYWTEFRVGLEKHYGYSLAYNATTAAGKAFTDAKQCIGDSCISRSSATPDAAPCECSEACTCGCQQGEPCTCDTKKSDLAEYQATERSVVTYRDGQPVRNVARGVVKGAAKIVRGVARVILPPYFDRRQHAKANGGWYLGKNLKGWYPGRRLFHRWQ